MGIFRCFLSLPEGNFWDTDLKFNSSPWKVTKSKKERIVFQSHPFSGATVDGRNPKQPPGIYKSLQIMVDNLPTSTGISIFRGMLLNIGGGILAKTVFDVTSWLCASQAFTRQTLTRITRRKRWYFGRTNHDIHRHRGVNSDVKTTEKA